MSFHNIVHVTENNHQYEVINYSQNTPVIIEFWASWCIECRTLSPLLEKIFAEQEGIFRLAKVDVDANHNLSLLYNIRSIPAIKAISHGKVVHEAFGLIPEKKIRELIATLGKSNSKNLTLEKASNLLIDHQWAQAEKAYREFLIKDPTQPGALLGISKTFIAQGNIEKALSILNNFPTCREAQNAELLKPLAIELENYKSDSLPALNELDITFKTSLRLIDNRNIPAALDGLLSIIRSDRSYRDGKARKVFLGVLELMGSETPEMRSYQQELAMLLF